MGVGEMGKSAEDLFIGAVLNGKADGVRRSVGLGLPLNDYLFDQFTFTALHYAVDREARPDVVAALLDSGADVNARAAGDTRDGRTPLMIAAYRGRVDLVRLLLAAGADLLAVDANGISALANAGWGGKTAAFAEVVRELLAAGARPDAEALAAAAMYGGPEMIRLLAEAGAQVNETSRWATALHQAVAGKRSAVVEALLIAGADPNLRAPTDCRDYPGQSALELARDRKLKKLVSLLEDPHAIVARAKETMQAAESQADADRTVCAAEAWDRLETALRTAAPKVGKSLKSGARVRRLTEVETALGSALPDDVRDSWLRHNGQKGGADGLLPSGFLGLDAEFCLLSAREALGEWEEWKELLDDGDFDGRPGVPDRGVRPEWWHPGWLPVASDGAGDSICLDLMPEEGGTVGQVILVDHESSSRPLLAGSWPELLVRLAEHYSAHRKRKRKA